jgi:cell wall-associated NlpC family hydrolase
VLPPRVRTTRSGPTKGIPLFKHARRVIAVTAGLSLLTLGFSVPPTTASSTAAAPNDPGAAASVSMAAFDYAAEARELDLLERATRSARSGVSRLGTVEVQAAAPVKVEPKKKPAAKKPVKKKAATTKAAGKTAGKSSKKPATGKATGAAGAKKPVTAAASGSTAKVVAYANAQIGKRYVFGTAGPNTFDCSGLVVAAYRQIGISLPHQTTPLAQRGRAVSRADLRPGDLVFPSSGHVGIYVGGGMIVHASNPKTGVKKSGIYAFWTARRIVG